MVVALGHRTAGNGDQVGLLRAGEGGTAPELLPVLQHRVQTALQIPRAQVGHRIGADAVRFGELGSTPAGVQLEQDPGALEGADVGFARCRNTDRRSWSIGERWTVRRVGMRHLLNQQVFAQHTPLHNI